MATEAVYFKEHEGILHSPVRQLASTPSPALWWGATGYGGQPFQPNPSPVERTRTGYGDHFAASKAVEQGMRESANIGSVTQFTISSVDSKNSRDALKSQICAKFPYVDPCYGVLSTHGPQLLGRVMLPLDFGTNDVPIFVNPKQYHAIMKSRERRAKAELKNKLPRFRKPYMHESRHLHAMRRPRGCGGRFLNTRTLHSDKGEAYLEKDSKGHQLTMPTDSKSSDILHSDSGTLSSPGEANGSVTTLSGSTEVTSNTYAQEDVDRFRMNLLRAPLHFLPVSGTIDTDRSIVMPSTWFVAADNCHDLKV